MDSTVTTTHLLKKLSKVPKLISEEEDPHFGLNDEAMERREIVHKENAFMRGAMKFDDYNYN